MTEPIILDERVVAVARRIVGEHGSVAAAEPALRAIYVGPHAEARTAALLYRLREREAEAAARRREAAPVPPPLRCSSTYTPTMAFFADDLDRAAAFLSKLENPEAGMAIVCRRFLGVHFPEDHERPGWARRSMASLRSHLRARGVAIAE